MAKTTKAAAGEPQEPSKTVKGYRITAGTFKAKNEAAGAVTEARKKGYAPVFMIEGDNYILVYADTEKKADAEKIAGEIKKEGLTAEIMEY